MTKSEVERLKPPPHCPYFLWNEEDGELDFLLAGVGQGGGILHVGVFEHTNRLEPDIRKLIALVAQHYWASAAYTLTAAVEVAHEQMRLWREFGEHPQT